MNVKSLVAATVVAACASGAAFAVVPPPTPIGPPPSASFSKTVAAGAFVDTWMFDLITPAIVAASITNVEITFGSFSFGSISDFGASLSGVPLLPGTFSSSGGGVTVTTKVLSGSTTLPAGIFSLTVSGTAGAGGASYGGNIVATAVPEPESYAMLLAGLGVMGAIAIRRNKQKGG